MINHYTRAPHVEAAGPVLPSAPNAALLIDFDNVTMGIRSDLSKELKTLLNSDIIKGKVTVQRAYADWRRYPQYIVPLSEASVDLIFAPAYGSSKKNATDIRMAIDGMELVFIRPEIGTYILLTGDSDFSSLVLKLKEYGKYVVGVGIQESSSDILVQNCDEYYSYSSITGLQKASVGDQGKSIDPWQLVTRASGKMLERGDVMRSDRLKQVMLEMSPGFEESKFGFSKFSKFLAEAASRGLVQLRKLDNGQHEVGPPGAGRGEDAQADGPGQKRPGAPRHSPEPGHSPELRRAPEPRRPAERNRAAAPVADAKGAPPKDGPDRKSVSVRGNGTTVPDPLAGAYRLLRKALLELSPENERTRDSDVKRRMLDLDRSFDEAELGFSKFSKFLTQAHEHEVVRIRRNEAGNYVVRLPRSDRGRPDEVPPAGASSGTESGAASESRVAAPKSSEAAPDAGAGASEPSAGDPEASKASPGPSASAAEAPAARKGGRTPRSPRQRMRRQSQRANEREQEEPDKEEREQEEPDKEEPDKEEHEKEEHEKEEQVAPEASPLDPSGLGLPTDPDAVRRYLANRYRGVGEKTAGRLVEAFGDRVFQVLHETPDRVEDILPPNRVAKVREAWQEDFARRSRSEPAAEPASAVARRTRLGRRRGSS